MGGSSPTAAIWLPPCPCQAQGACAPAEPISPGTHQHNLELAHAVGSRDGWLGRDGEGAGAGAALWGDGLLRQHRHVGGRVDAREGVGPAAHGGPVGVGAGKLHAQRALAAGQGGGAWLCREVGVACRRDRGRRRPAMFGQCSPLAGCQSLVRWTPARPSPTKKMVPAPVGRVALALLALVRQGRVAPVMVATLSSACGSALSQ